MSDSEREQAVRDALGRWLTAAERGDATALEPMLTDSYTYTHATTAIADSRAEWLEIFNPASPKYRRYRVYAVEDVTVRLFPGTAIVAGSGHQEIIRPNGDELDLNTSFTCVWIETDGAWQLAAWQATRFPDA